MKPDFDHSLLFRWLTLLTLAGCLALAGCKVPLALHAPVAAPEKTGELVVVSRQGVAGRFEDGDGKYAGLENDLVTMFARQYGYRVRWLMADDVAGMVSLMQQYQAHLLAAGLKLSQQSAAGLEVSAPYLSMHEVLVCNTLVKCPASLSDLSGLRVAAVAGSQHVDTLRSLARQIRGLHWVAVDHAWDDQLLERLSLGEFDAVLVDSTAWSGVRYLYANLTSSVVALNGVEALRWAFPPHADSRLRAQVRQFLQQVVANGQLRQMIERYYGFTDRLEDADIREFLHQMSHTLPRFRSVFYDAQVVSGIDWRLLAAISYQESHWDPFATSPTGVRGMMMMTGDTADKMGITNRLDVQQSVVGGAMYLSQLMAMQNIPDDDPDRVWLALAAYNQGQGHLEDARSLARHQHLNPDAWCDVKQTLPLLSGNSHLVDGYTYCRGGEAVIFVESIRTYYAILKKYEPAWQPLTGN